MRLSTLFELEQKQEAKLLAGQNPLKSVFCQQRIWLQVSQQQ